MPQSFMLIAFICLSSKNETGGNSKAIFEASVMTSWRLMGGREAAVM